MLLDKVILSFAVLINVLLTGLSDFSFQLIIFTANHRMSPKIIPKRQMSPQTRISSSKCMDLMSSIFPSLSKVSPPWNPHFPKPLITQ